MDVFVPKHRENSQRLVDALEELGFKVETTRLEEILRGNDFVEIKDGTFYVDLIFAPDGIERLEDAWGRRLQVSGFTLCHLDDIIQSKEAANRLKDRESLERLRDFREYLRSKRLL